MFYCGNFSKTRVAWILSPPRNPVLTAEAVVTHKNKILVHRNTRENHYALLGGRVKIGENSEGKEYLQYEWLDLDKIGEYPIMPEAIKEVLKAKEPPAHVINTDK